ncbi:hypothetical protein GE061_010664 [Apolygus lucorum]|uniref:BTB domain-containing protein n=1 Tax=Apolygus lucorum TaxID=248454 RepID=A0A6A4JTA5_APOLU|nr:hypothetical protein GE061_010664 [Apolygus lucorum]
MHNSPGDCKSFMLMHNQLLGYAKKGLFTDVIFLVGDSKLKAHKAVLASSSIVFQTMFESQLEESRSNEVTITDVEAEVFSDFLDYVYLRGAHSVTKHLRQMVMLADKYDIKSLSSLCDSKIAESLTRENAFDALLIADLYRRTNLKRKVMSFVKNEINFALSEEKWIQLENNVNLMRDLYMFSINEREVDHIYRGTVVFPCLNRADWYNKDKVATALVTFDDSTSKTIFRVTLTGADGALALLIQSDTPVDDVLIFITCRTLYGHQAFGKLHYNYCETRLADESKLFIPGNMLHYEKDHLTINVSVARENIPLLYSEFRDRRFSDCVLIGEGGQVSAHKFILAEKSEYFSELLKDEQKEYVFDIPVRTLAELVQYMYNTAEYQHTEWKVDLPLLRGAKKFKLENLVNFCVEAMRICEENAGDVFSTAKELGSEELASRALLVALTSNSEKIPVKQLKALLMNMPRITSKKRH